MPHADNFLLIVPEGFTEIVGATAIINGNVGLGGIQSIINDRSFYDINEFAGIKETAYLPEGYTVVDARFFDTGEPGEPYRFWIKIAPIPV